MYSPASGVRERWRVDELLGRGTRYIFSAGAKAFCRRSRLTSNYKGFPICQASLGHDELRSDSSMEIGTLPTEPIRALMNGAKGADWANYNRSSMQS